MLVQHITVAQHITAAHKYSYCRTITVTCCCFVQRQYWISPLHLDAPSSFLSQRAVSPWSRVMLISQRAVWRWKLKERWWRWPLSKQKKKKNCFWILEKKFLKIFQGGVGRNSICNHCESGELGCFYIIFLNGNQKELLNCYMTSWTYYNISKKNLLIFKDRSRRKSEKKYWLPHSS